MDFWEAQWKDEDYDKEAWSSSIPMSKHHSGYKSMIYLWKGWQQISQNGLDHP